MSKADHSATSDKRRLERIDVGETIKVLNRMGGQELGRVANIHEEGFMMIGQDEVVFEGGVFQLDFIWESSENNEETEEFSLGAECLWRKPGETQTWSGFTIIDKGESDSAIIERIVSAFKQSS